MFGPFVHRLQDFRLQTTATSISRRGLRVEPAQLIASLPTLGNVLYVPMRPHGSADWGMPRGLLVEMMQLAPLLQAIQLVAGSTVTVEGPREWIECVDRYGRACARLHLLPDTDYLAWDGLLARAVPEAMPNLLDRPWRAWRARPVSAQVLRFHLHRLAGLDVLGAEVTTSVSPLSRHLAGLIARAEAVPLQPVGGG